MLSNVPRHLFGNLDRGGGPYLGPGQDGSEDTGLLCRATVQTIPKLMNEGM